MGFVGGASEAGRMPLYNSNSFFNSPPVLTFIKLSITTIRTVEVSKVHVVKVVANKLLVRLVILYMAAKLSQWHVSFDKVGTRPCFCSMF